MTGPASNNDYYTHVQNNPYSRNTQQSPNFVSTPSYHHYVEQQRARESHLQPVISEQSDTTNTCVEYNSDDSSMDGFETAPRKSKKVRDQKKSMRHLQKRQVVQVERLSSVGSNGSTDSTEELKNEKRMFSFLFSRNVPPVPSEDERKYYPWKTTNLINRGVFYWLWPILVKGYKRTLKPADLWRLPENLTVEDMHKKYRAHLDKILNKRRSKYLKKHPNLEGFQWPMWAVPLALFYTFKLQYSMSCFFLALSFVCQACSPLITKKLIDFVQSSYEDRFFGLDVSYNTGIGYTVGAVVLIFINGLLLNHFFHNAMVAGAAVKLILTKDILLKSFTMLAKEKHKFSVGRVTSLMSTDLLRIDLAVGFQPLVICFPIPVVIAIVLLLHNIGVTSLAGIGLFVVSLIVCVLLTSKLFFTRETVVKFTDKRISLMREVLNNLKVIKFYAWEMAYKANITKVREREMRYLFTIKVLRNFITAYAVTLPTLTSMVSFVTMWSTNNMKAPSEVFSSLSLFSILAQAIMLLPIALATGADAMIGFRRLKDFLGSAEYDEELDRKLAKGELYIGGEELLVDFEFTNYDTMSMNSDTYISREKYALSVVVEVSHADFMWEQFHDDQDDENSIWEDTASMKATKLVEKNRNSEAYTPKISFESTSSMKQTAFPGLLDINLTVNAGEFVVITGVIGSGKSSLLNALAGFMKMTNPEVGRLQVNCDLLLCGQPWIQNTTVRENILFGKPMDRSRYDMILRACSLVDDLNELTYGDQTEIGERGITLSGGQKARINLARAVYNGADCLLFDDVLSAVDARVGKHITTYLFQGLLRNHTRILATHQLSLVQSADKIVFLNGDGSIDVGSLSELASRNAGFRKLIEFSHESTKQQEEEEIKASSINYSNDDIKSNNVCLLPTSGNMSPNDDPYDEEKKLMRQQSVLPENSASGDLIGKTIEEESMGVNRISWNVYKNYINLGSGIFGITVGPVFLLLVALATFCQLFTNTWLSFWMEKKFKHLLDRFYVAFYVMFAVLTVFFTGIQFTMLAYMNNRSAEILNLKAVDKVLHAPMSFMDTNPLGRVLNRFTKDTDSLDNEIGEQLRLFIFPLATIIGINILCICYLPWFAIAVPFLGGVFIFLSDIYSGSSREIKRLEAVQRSVVYNNFNETLTGMSTIKAYKSEQKFMEKNDYLLNRMNEAYFLSIATQRWLCVHLDMIASIFALIICLLCITNQFNISASSTGLLLNYVIQIVGLLSLTVRAMTQVENEMNSVERLHSYAFDLPQEAAYEKSEFKPPPEWPMAGYIQFNDVSMRYRQSLPLVLKNLDFGVYPGEKVGICGRTGAGKSSIMTGLYRLSEVESGSITIDGLDISQMGLRDLRSKLLIIPQDPVLFQGTIRKNLDPFSQFTDEVLWDSLRRSGLIDEEVLERVKLTKLTDNNYDMLHKYHLDQSVEDDGCNFSLGEKQLIALARSLVRNSKILILDEATSSVDYETDAKIQETIIREFNQCTILCIAHRLKTILSYDRILVMDQGRIVEKGTPWTLFRQNGVFKQMCDKAHITAQDFHQ
ncbi:CIC11C00000002870 [Sungouiella intermedia]|uniref:CIC11C00000002870 n=1 Tax=Sungouiella intermedia TaxID=45354 RepID=A0A1L0BVB1_9ASCO|nr:CIC11C00000002870 [[Candida] intermedia]